MTRDEEATDGEIGGHDDEAGERETPSSAFLA